MEHTPKPRTGNTRPEKQQPGTARPDARPDAPLPDSLDDQVRHDKVASIREALQNGTYRVSSDDVARKLIDHMLRPKS